MASNESILDKLNLSSGERRLVMIVLVVLMCALAWMVWGMIPNPTETRQKIDKANNELARFGGEIKKTDTYHRRIRELEGMGSAVVPIAQEVKMRRDINSLTAANGVIVTSTGRMTTETKEFFLEKSLPIRFSSKESDIVKFLWALGGSDSMVRVSDMSIKPDKNRYRLSGSMNLTASYQKNVKATQPKATETKSKPVAAKPSEAKPAAETKPELKPVAANPLPAKRTVPKRSIPTRPVRKTQ